MATLHNKLKKIVVVIWPSYKNKFKKLVLFKKQYLVTKLFTKNITECIYIHI